MKKRLLLLFLCFTLIGQMSFAQASFFDRQPFSITIFTHSIGVPFKDYIKQPLNLGFSIGTEFLWRDGELTTTTQGIQLGWYHHKNLGTGLFLKTDLTQRFYSNAGIFGEVSLSGGMFHSFSISDVYELNSTGNYAKVKDKGHSSFLVGGGIGAGTLINEQFNPYVKYDALLEMPYTKFIPAMPHLLFGVGNWSLF